MQCGIMWIQNFVFLVNQYKCELKDSPTIGSGFFQQGRRNDFKSTVSCPYIVKNLHFQKYFFPKSIDSKVTFQKSTVSWDTVDTVPTPALCNEEVSRITKMVHNMSLFIPWLSNLGCFWPYSMDECKLIMQRLDL